MGAGGQKKIRGAKEKHRKGKEDRKSTATTDDHKNEKLRNKKKTRAKVTKKRIK